MNNKLMYPTNEDYKEKTLQIVQQIIVKKAKQNS